MARLRKKGDIAGLRTAAHDYRTIKDADRWFDAGAETRMQAVTALSDFYGPAVVEALVEALDDRDQRVRILAVRGLRKLGAAAPCEPLIAALVNSDDQRLRPFRSQILAVLVDREDERLPERLVHSLLLKAEPVGGADQEALETLLASDPRGDAARSALAAEVVEHLDHEDPDRHAQAERVLAWLPEQSVAPSLALLRKGRASPSAVRVLGASGAPQAVEPLVGFLDGPEPEIRAAAAAALGRIKDTRAVEALLAATQDPELAVRESAIRALDGMGTAAVTFGLASLVRPALPAGASEAVSRLDAGPGALPEYPALDRMLESGSD